MTEPTPTVDEPLASVKKGEKVVVEESRAGPNTEVGSASKVIESRPGMVHADLVIPTNAEETMQEIKADQYEHADVIDILPQDETQKLDKDMHCFLEGLCLCGRCKWPFAPGQRIFFNNLRTLYQQDYIPRKKLDDSFKIIVTDLQKNTYPREVIDCASTMKVHIFHLVSTNFLGVDGLSGTWLCHDNVHETDRGATSRCPHLKCDDIPGTISRRSMRNELNRRIISTSARILCIIQRGAN
jgi:hypothetical protein